MHRHAVSAPTLGDSSSYEYRHGAANPNHSLIFRAIGETMDNRWSHGLLPADFLRTFLPKEREGMPPFTEARKDRIKNVFTENKSERQRYNPLILALEDYCPNLQLTNTDYHPETIKWDHHSVGLDPDITGYDKQNLPPKGTVTSMALAEVIIELKTKQFHDPCIKDLAATVSSLHYSDHDTQEAVKTRDQISTYAGAVMSSQFRTHFFSVIIMGEYARLIRWDRAGATITQRFHVWDEPHLVQFLWRYDSADREARGHDPCVERLKESQPGQRTRINKVRSILHMSYPEPVYQFKINDENQEGKVHIFLGGKIVNQTPPTPRGRCTRGFLVTTPEAADGCLSASTSDGHPVYYLKSTWRIFTNLLETEGRTYKKLQAARVPYIPTLIASGDARGNWQETFTDPKWFKEYPPVRQHHNYYAVFKEVGSSLLKFKSQAEFLNAMRDALEAHRVAYCDARILHRDISAGNILIYKGRGLLIDWEFSKPVTLHGDPIPRQSERTGTWQFISARILMAGGKIITHTLTDDLESFFHVLCWVALQCTEHALSTSATVAFLQNVYDYSFCSNGDDQGGENKYLAIIGKTLSTKVEFTSRPLARLVGELEAAFCTWYQNNDQKGGSVTDPRSWGKEDVLTWFKAKVMQDSDVLEKITANNLTGESLVDLDEHLLDSMGITDSGVQWIVIDAVEQLKKTTNAVVPHEPAKLDDHRWMLDRFSQFTGALKIVPQRYNPPALTRSSLQEAVRNTAPENARKEKKRKMQGELQSQRASQKDAATELPGMVVGEEAQSEPAQKKLRKAKAPDQSSRIREGISESSDLSQTEAVVRRSARIQHRKNRSGSPSRGRRRSPSGTSR
ncbi:hypothetical protein E1B28_013740 [Marasmius oreades]|uniref:SAM domain-containing protein n=1 Tax=Marasmius oreades TaxID=181124 RepID=A0A9P7UQ69_9AGAR|nr:uncharacterized protein E1B28_013740 [Marasmius oreades]KAG7087799.1 hypothetical protein E1B28_013740 [Marasmius oreades]